jgi:cold shock CspA family protein
MNASSTTAQHTGVITRICNFKYGFLSSDEHANIFFHFSELSDDAKAFVEPGQQVTFQTAPNGDNKIKAVKLQVISAAGENKFKHLSGVIQSDMNARGFTLILEDKTLDTYLFHATNLVNDEASKDAGNTVTEGHRVTFDAEWNHKHTPPKPFATNVRIVSGQTELNKVSAALEQQPMQPSRESSTWQRGSRLGLTALPEESDASSSPPNRLGSVGRMSSVRDRASALKSNAPVRRWSRTTNLSGENKSDKPAGGLRLTVTTCKFGRKCGHKDCWFEHPNGRQMDGTAVGSDSDSEESSGDEKVSSMGKASLKLLIKAIVDGTGKRGYLHIRNYLQKPEYVGRTLTRDEKNAIGEILEELETTPAGSAAKKQTRESTKGRSWRQSSNSRLPIARTSFANGRVSLSDMCRDPSLHSRLSSANNQACA